MEQIHHLAYRMFGHQAFYVLRGVAFLDDGGPARVEFEDKDTVRVFLTERQRGDLRTVAHELGHVYHSRLYAEWTEVATLEACEAVACLAEDLGLRVIENRWDFPVVSFRPIALEKAARIASIVRDAAPDDFPWQVYLLTRGDFDGQVTEIREQPPTDGDFGEAG